MEINITRFVSDAEPFDFSSSIAERGENAGRDTWKNAKREGNDHPLLTTKEELEALREYVKGLAHGMTKKLLRGMRPNVMLCSFNWLVAICEKPAWMIHS